MPSNVSSSSLTIRRIRSEASARVHAVADLPSKRSGSSSARKSWKSSSLPVCGVAVISRRWRVMPAEQLAELVALRLLDLAAEEVGRHLVRLVDRRPGPSRSARASPGGPRCGESWSSRAIDQVRLRERVAAARRLDRVAGEDRRTRARTSARARPATARRGCPGRRSGSARGRRGRSAP